jgi:hypothetical protein
MGIMVLVFKQWFQKFCLSPASEGPAHVVFVDSW